MRNRLFALCSLWLLSCSSAAHACKEPVYLYARQNWRAENYQVDVRHLRPLKPHQQQILSTLDELSRQVKPSVNIGISEDSVQPETTGAGIAIGDSDQPILCVRLPESMSRRTIFWKAPLSDSDINQLVDSPARQKVVSALESDTAIAWLFVHAKNRDENVASLDRLKSAVDAWNHSATTSQQSQAAHPMLTSADPSAAASYAIATVVQMRHDDKAEAFFLASLLAMMNQDSFTEPVAVAIYGQGRAHTALVGSQINDRNITSACQYVSGECSCTIKAQSPGCDLLLKANWPAPDIEVPALEVIDLPPVDTATPSRYTSQPSILTHDGATRNIQKAQPVTADLRAPPSSRIIHTAIMSLMIVAGLSISVAAVVFLRTSHIRP